MLGTQAHWSGPGYASEGGGVASDRLALVKREFCRFVSILKSIPSGTAHILERPSSLYAWGQDRSRNDSLMGSMERSLPASPHFLIQCRTFSPTRRRSDGPHIKPIWVMGIPRWMRIFAIKQASKSDIFSFSGWGLALGGSKPKRAWM